MFGKSHVFAVADYVVFALTLTVSLGIGVYSALTGGRQKTTREFLVGNREMKVLPVTLSLIVSSTMPYPYYLMTDSPHRNMKVFPVTLSLIVSYESSIMMLGLPGEMYVYGAAYWLASVSWCACVIMMAFLFVPTFFNLKVVSVYEYLRGRFESQTVYLMGSFLGGMSNLWYMGVVLYGPATALHAVTGFEMWLSIVIISLVAMVYTTIGGIKAVIWADAFQTFIMVGGMLAVIIKGTLAVGGIANVFAINSRGGRLHLNFDLDPTIRITFWGVTIGNFFRYMSIGFNQTSVQRVSAMPTLAKAKLITILSAPGFLFFGTLACLEGLVAYAYFSHTQCDPLQSGNIQNPNQIVPFFVMELFSHLPGLPGLFLASLFSASLSTLSSGYASISAIVWTDFIKPHVPNIAEYKATIITKVLVIVAGSLSIGIALLVMGIGGPMNQIGATLMSSFNGPLVLLFLLGGLVPQANPKGALAAVTTSAIFATWKGMGTSFSPEVVKTPYLTPASTENCSLYNYSNITAGIVTDTPLGYPNVTGVPLADFHSADQGTQHWSPLKAFYSISFLWIVIMSVAIGMVVGIVVSYATGGRDKKDIDRRYLMPMGERLCCCLPCFRATSKEKEAVPMHDKDTTSEHITHVEGLDDQLILVPIS